MPAWKKHLALMQRFKRKQGAMDPTGFAAALRQIQQGKKTSHWMWWIWPAFAPLRRQTTQPDFLLPTLESGMAYITDPVLRKNLLKITEVATAKLGAHHTAERMLGKEDAVKFAECMTFFSVVCIEFQKWVYFSIFVAALYMLGNGPDKRTLQAIGGRYLPTQSIPDLMSQTQCDMCHRIRYSILCGKLCGARYCSESCKQRAWGAGHKIMCPNKSPRKNRATPVKPAQRAGQPAVYRGPFKTSSTGNNCTFHSLFGVKNRVTEVYSTVAAERMRAELIKFMGSFASVADMEPVHLRPKAMASLAEFYLERLLPNNFVGTTTLMERREEYLESIDELQARLLSLRLATSQRVRREIETAVTAGSGVGIKLLNTLVMTVLRVKQPTSRMFPLAEAFRSGWAESWPQTWPAMQSLYDDKIPLDPMSFELPQSPDLPWKVLDALMGEHNIDAIREMVANDTRYYRRMLPTAEEEAEYRKLEADTTSNQAQFDFLSNPLLWQQMVAYLRHPNQRAYCFQIPDLAFLAQLSQCAISIETPYIDMTVKNAHVHTVAPGRAGLRNLATKQEYRPPGDLFGEEGRKLYIMNQGFTHFERMVPHI